MEDEIISTKRFLEGSNIIVCDEWLESCIQWFKEENANNAYTLKELQTQVYEQWLLLDLRDVNVPVLPPNVTEQKKLIIHKHMCLQLMSITDISKPKFAQLQNIRNKNSLLHQSEDNNVTGKRVLQLTLTDGLQQILATEYIPIQHISLSLTPGIKVCVHSPVTIRRGQILLEPKSIKILGGEVEEILITHAAENILASTLGLPINENPNTFENAERDVIQRANTNQLLVNITNNLSNQVNRFNDFNEDMEFAGEVDKILDAEINKNARTNTSHDLFDDDMDFDAEELDNLTNKAQDFRNTTSNARNISFGQTHAAPTREIPHKPLTYAINKNNDIFEDDFDADEYEELIKLENTTPKMPVEEKKQIISKPIMPIEKLLKLKTKVNKGFFTINAAFKNVIEKLIISDNAYSIKISVGDVTGEIELYLHSDIISDLIGYDPEAMMSLKNSNNDETRVVTLLKIMNNFKDKLIALNSKMEVLVEASKDTPTVIKLIC